MKQILLALLALAALSACNTFQGLGKDIENAGESISSGAQQAKDRIDGK